MTDSPYFKWAAHDDLLAPSFLAACVDVLDSDPTVILASPASMLIDEAGSPLFLFGRAWRHDRPLGRVLASDAGKE
jgi:hypothetical protein